jgi:hypothetical protein
MTNIVKNGNNSGYLPHGRSMHDHFSVSLKCNAWDGDKYCENGEKFRLFFPWE